MISSKARNYSKRFDAAWSKIFQNTNFAQIISAKYRFLAVCAFFAVSTFNFGDVRAFKIIRANVRRCPADGVAEYKLHVFIIE